MAEKNSFPVWNKAETQQSLDAVYAWAVENAEQSIAYYKEKKYSVRILSKRLRSLSIFFVAVGALCPLLDATQVVEKYINPNIFLGRWGYVFLAIGAAVIGFDFYFGHSSGWIRFVVTEISIARALREFQYDWTILQARQPLGSDYSRTLVFLQRAKDFTLQIENLSKHEVDSWVAEFQANIAQLEKVLKTDTKGQQRTTSDSSR